MVLWLFCGISPNSFSYGWISFNVIHLKTLYNVHDIYRRPRSNTWPGLKYQCCIVTSRNVLDIHWAATRSWVLQKSKISVHWLVENEQAMVCSDVSRCGCPFWKNRRRDALVCSWYKCNEMGGPLYLPSNVICPPLTTQHVAQNKGDGFITGLDLQPRFCTQNAELLVGWQKSSD